MYPNGNFNGSTADASVRGIEIPLDDDLVNTLHRRSRRQLRNIQASSACTIKLSRMRKTLHVVGKEEDIARVRHQLQGLYGPRKTVSHAVWAELMRTRTVQLEELADVHAPSSIANLQEMSGCRIHVERSRCEVRLFGSEEAVQSASHLIDALAKECIEETVACSADSPIRNVAMMQAFGQSHGVLFSNGEPSIAILGMQGSVRAAAEHVRSCIAGHKEWPAAVAADPNSDGSEGMVLPADVNTDSSTDCTRQSRYDASASAPKQFHEITHNNALLQQHQQQQQRYMHGPEPSVQSTPTTCPTCGACRFCTGCGAPVFQHSGNWVWVPDGGADSSSSKSTAMAQTGQKPNVQLHTHMASSARVPNQDASFPQHNHATRNAGESLNYEGVYQPQSPNLMMPMTFPNGMQGIMQQPGMDNAHQQHQHGTIPTIGAAQDAQLQTSKRGWYDKPADNRWLAA